MDKLTAVQVQLSDHNAFIRQIDTIVASNRQDDVHCERLWQHSQICHIKMRRGSDLLNVWHK